MSPDDELAARLRAERDATEAQVASLTRDLADIVDGADLVATDDEHDPEGHTIAWERQQVAALLDAARVHRDDLDLALARVAAGTYGTCETCGRPIGTERLAALPATATCVACAP
ncbi:TraR/DksA C4-type zinc finger protein [Iamia majanohamensis]|uniref:TraR/DksA C4-type zinc finger protein n=1 Tax=Iamia majanohamensis TaxID=467976 RepID=A0AAF0BVN1_9ACTN|nr:TraR/DksA C4-type zinc finger protein [Iamia majanohamensis]WCO66940.1 TraR/DksA C4-type zinc finger protein [Iamia majanohamensis]